MGIRTDEAMPLRTTVSGCPSFACDQNTAIEDPFITQDEQDGCFSLNCRPKKRNAAKNVRLIGSEIERQGKHLPPLLADGASTMARRLRCGASSENGAADEESIEFIVGPTENTDDIGVPEIHVSIMEPLDENRPQSEWRKTVRHTLAARQALVRHAPVFFGQLGGTLSKADGSSAERGGPGIEALTDNIGFLHERSHSMSDFDLQRKTRSDSIDKRQHSNDASLRRSASDLDTTSGKNSFMSAWDDNRLDQAAAATRSKGPSRYYCMSFLTSIILAAQY